MKLDCNQICTWTDLVKAFLAQYYHVVDITPDRMALMTIEKKETKIFKEYVISGEMSLHKSNLF